ncbi:endonuclease V isoform X1 [Podarcis raffonei]|uniref:endonuclease V isoform X1 n=1 Tax=Podarcis raffonei TaxID=65483 RepID=UPI0023298D4C|nr:endonuclease V isoform X1 [Podarcis raffonei]
MADRAESEVRVAEETLRAWERDQAQLKADVIDQDTEEWQSNPSFAGLERVGGVDLSYIKGDDTSACASLVVLSYPDLEVLYEDCCMVAVNAPYVAGFLAFREVPFLVEALQRLEQKEPGLRPQVLLVDGNGILHHRGFGIACHLGVLTGLPCVGVAKNLLQVDGLANDELHKEQIQDLQAGGDTFPLLSTSGKILGMALRSYAKSTKPVYVSVGHKMSLLSAVQLVHSCCRYRVPEPIRQADIRSREYIRKHLEAVSASPQPERMSEDTDSEH